METSQPQEIFFQDDGLIPNSVFPLLLYRKALDTPVDPDQLEQQLKNNNWTNGWRYGIYCYHHYHSNTHEVLAVTNGYAHLLLGGENGQKLDVEQGDVLIVPAGVGHKCLSHSDDFLVFGAYPDGYEPDLKRANATDRATADEHISEVPIPETDPLFGKSAGLAGIWTKYASEQISR
jgi:uncharacterized protein YjlB